MKSILTKFIIKIALWVLVVYGIVKVCDIIWNITEHRQSVPPIEVSEAKQRYFVSEEYKRIIYPLKRKVKQLELELKLCKGGK